MPALLHHRGSGLVSTAVYVLHHSLTKLLTPLANPPSCTTLEDSLLLLSVTAPSSKSKWSSTGLMLPGSRSGPSLPPAPSAVTSWSNKLKPLPACLFLSLLLPFPFLLSLLGLCPSRNSFSQSPTELTSTRLHDVQASPDWIGLHLPVCERGNPATFSPSLVSRCKLDLQVPKCRLRVVSLIQESPNIEPVVTHYRLVHGQCWTVQKVGCPCYVP